ncbi:MAG: hypothetical protein LBV15_00005, partial [Planctomycetota bacterium]|nr:hypothetical protein [Planctomycetota bacterium]
MTVNGPDVAGLRQLQTQLTNVGNNYVGLTGDRDLRAQTTGVFSRWAARSFLSPEKAEANRRTADALLEKIRQTPGASQELIQSLSGRFAAALTSGKPLSGRTAATIVQSAVDDLQEQFVRKAQVNLN